MGKNSKRNRRAKGIFPNKLERLGILNVTETGRLNDRMKNLNISNVNNDCDDSRNCPPRSKIKLSTEEQSSQEPDQLFKTAKQMTDIIKDQFTVMYKLLRSNFPSGGILCIKSDEDIELKFAECERVRIIFCLLKKAIDRCRKLEIFYLADILNGKKSYSTMNPASVKRAIKFIAENFESRKCLTLLTNSANKIEEHLKYFCIKLAEAASDSEHRMKESKCKKGLPSLESIQDLITPIDKQIASTLTVLLNSAENILLPMLYEVEILTESNIPVKSHLCDETPQSIRKQMILLEEILSDTEDLSIYMQAPIAELDDFLDEAKLWMDNCISLHQQLPSIYLKFFYYVKELDILTPSMTLKQYEELISLYNAIRTGHDAMRTLIATSKRVDRLRFEDISRRLLQFCESVDKTDIFISIMIVFYWLPIVSGKHYEFIQDDDKYLNNFIERMINPELAA